MKIHTFYDHLSDENCLNFEYRFSVATSAPEVCFPTDKAT